MLQILNYAIQPTCRKNRLVVHSDCHKNVANLRASGLCLLEQSPRPLIYPLQQKISWYISLHTKNVNLKRELLTVPPRQRRQKLIEFLPAHKNIEFQNLRIECANTQFYRYSKWLCGHDPQGGISDGSFFASSLLSHNQWLKIFF